MGASLIITALVDSDDETYQKHKKVLLACAEAGIKLLPKETADFFGHAHVDPFYVEQPLERKLQLHTYRKEYEDGYEIKVKELPPEVTTIRVTLSY